MLGGISRTTHIVSANATNGTNFECHPGGESHGTLLLSVASAGIAANLSLAGLIMTRKALRRWSSGLILHGAFVDALRAGLLVPLGISVYKCQPVKICSLVDTAFLLLATVTSLNLLSASLSDAPLIPPPILAPQLLESAGFLRSQGAGHYESPLYPKDLYEEDPFLITDAVGMPDSPQCILFGTFMVWFAALTINLGPTFLSGALAAHAEVIPNIPSCPLVRGHERHVVLNVLWAGVNLLCVGLAAFQLRTLKKDLAHAKVGILAAGAAGLAGMTGITNTVPGGSGGSKGSHHTLEDLYQPSSSRAALQKNAEAERRKGGESKHITPSEIDSFMRRAQKKGRYHIRTLGTLTIINLICWVPLYLCAIFKPIGTGGWEDDPGLYIYEVCLLISFAHTAIHPILLLFLHENLWAALKTCLTEWLCCLCIGLGVGIYPPDLERRGSRSSHRSRSCHSPHSHSHSRRSSRSGGGGGGGGGGVGGVRQHSTESLHVSSLKRSCSIKSDGHLGSPSNSNSPLPEDLLPPPPLPPSNSGFRKLV